MKKKIGLYLQGIFTLLAIVFAIVSIFNNDFIIVIQMLLGLDLLAMAYNNQVLYKRRLFTILYVVAALVVIVMSLIGV